VGLSLQVAEVRLARFLEEMVVPPNMVDTILDGEVNEEYMRVLQVLSKKLTYVAENHATKDYAALQDVIPEIEKLQIKAVSKVLSAHFQAYIQPLERLQLDIVTKSDLIGLEDTGTHHSPGLFSQAWEPLKNCAAVFALGQLGFPTKSKLQFHHS
jgi:hypothetical protein